MRTGTISPLSSDASLPPCPAAVETSVAFTANEALSEELCAKMLGWRHRGGFSAHNQVRVATEDREGRMKLAGYMIRAPMSLEKMTYDRATGTVIYVRSICSMRDLASVPSGRVAVIRPKFPSVGNGSWSGRSWEHFLHLASGRSWPTTACDTFSLLIFWPAAAFQRHEPSLSTLSRPCLLSDAYGRSNFIAVTARSPDAGRLPRIGGPQFLG